MEINHAVQAVGYGWKDGKQFLIIRNQWDTTWGEDGYMRIEMDNSVYGPCAVYPLSFQTDLDIADIINPDTMPIPFWTYQLLFYYLYVNKLLLF